MEAHENRWQDEEGETEEKRAGGGSSQRVGTQEMVGVMQQCNVENGPKGGNQEKKGRNGRWGAWTTLSTNYY